MLNGHRCIVYIETSTTTRPTTSTTMSSTTNSETNIEVTLKNLEDKFDLKLIERDNIIQQCKFSYLLSISFRLGGIQ